MSSLETVKTIEEMSTLEKVIEAEDKATELINEALTKKEQLILKSTEEANEKAANIVKAANLEETKITQAALTRAKEIDHEMKKELDEIELMVKNSVKEKVDEGVKFILERMIVK